MTIKSYEFDKLVGKFGLKVRKSGDKLAWLEYDGKAALFLTTKKPLTRLFVWRLPGDCTTYNLCK